MSSVRGDSAERSDSVRKSQRIADRKISVNYSETKRQGKRAELQDVSRAISAMEPQEGSARRKDDSDETVRPKSPTEERPISRAASTSSRVSSRSATATIRRRQLEAEIEAADEKARLQATAAATATAAAAARRKARADAAELEAAAEDAASAAAEEQKILMENLEKKLEIQKLIIEAEVLEELGSETTSIAEERSTRQSRQIAPRSAKQRTTTWVETHSETPRAPQMTPMQENVNIKSVPVPVNVSDLIVPHLNYARANLLKDLPKFSGDAREWPIFAALFDQGTNMCGFSNADNLVRLQQSLQGPARETVRAMLLDPRNVPDIRRVLERRFGRPGARIDDLLAEARRTPPVGVSESMAKLVEYGTIVGNIVYSLKNMGHDAYLMNPTLLKELVMKLPQHLRLGWYSAGYGDHPNLADFGEWLDKIVDAASQEDVPRPLVREYINRRERPRSPQNKRIYTTTAKQTTSECLKCAKKNHKTSECRFLLKLKVSERWDWVKKENLCIRCLRKGHDYRDCKIQNKCNLDGCNQPHNRILHNKNKTRTSSSSPATDSRPNEPESTSSAVTSTWDESAEVLLRVVTVEIRGPGGVQTALALCDEGSTISLVEEELADKIGAVGPESPLRLVGASGMATNDGVARRINFEIRPLNGKTFYELNGARTVKNLNLPNQSFNAKKMTQKWPHLKNVPLCDINGRPQILIGIDHWHLIVPRTIISGKACGPIATSCRLGWTLGGGTNKVQTKKHQVTHTRQAELIQLDELVRGYFCLEELGEKRREYRQNVDARANKLLQATTKLVDGRWRTGLLWKRDDITLPFSKEMAKRRLISIENKLIKNPSLAQKYDEKIKDFINKGYARKLSEQEKIADGNKIWYLPHFAVENQNKPGKLRLVFDCAAKSNGTSLNENLLTGPDLLNPLISVLFKFRQGIYGFTADIKEMFLQVQLTPEDTHSQRFLWRELKQKQEPEEYLMKVVLFGSTSSPCSAQHVKNMNAIRFTEEFPEAVDAIVNRHYMDDYLDSRDTIESAQTMIKNVRHIHQCGGFDITNWASSHPTVIKEIPEEACSQTSVTWTGPEAANERILGLKWESCTDTLSFDTNFKKVPPSLLSGEIIPTKRQTLSIIMSVFDPLGVLGPLAIKAKILLQQIWLEKTEWDERISNQALVNWEAWLADLQRVKTIKIPRSYQANGHKKVHAAQLHVFADASVKAYAAVAYVRYRTEEGNICTTFIAGKNKVAPLKALSLPRLELQAATLASRLADTIRKHHTWEFQETYLWSDSKTVLSWIRKDPREFHVFVAHRLGEIDQLSKPSEWRWVPTKQNPADNATRNTAAKNHNHLFEDWISGPMFLKQDEKYWPQDLDIFSGEEGMEELKRSVNTVAEATLEPLCDISRFSKLNRLVRATAWCLRFISRCRRKSEKERYLTAAELYRAEHYWLKQSQLESFSTEISAIKNKVSIAKNSRLNQLNAYLDEHEILRVGGRINAIQGVALEVKKPAILDSKHAYTKLLIQHHHEKAGHKGREFVGNELRQQYWILRLRGTIRKIGRDCRYCQLERAKPMPPKMADLPEVRLEHHIRPFSNVGWDFFGPVDVAVGRRREKRYGSLFCCMNTRAVHVEITHSLSSDAALMALKRMCARRGTPSVIYSDNGTNLRGANNELKRALEGIDFENLKSQCAMQKIEWKFITPSAPHMAGVYERLVQSIKKALYITLKEKAPRDETLATLMAEAENSVNSRPLTYVSIDNKDQESLTPNHFLLGSTSGRLNIGIIDSDSLCLKKQWRIAQVLANHFWNRFVREYLPTLAKRSKWQNEVKPIAVGDIAFLVDQQLPRNTWVRGRITQVYPGPDGQVRSVTIQCRGKQYRRPATKIAVIAITPKNSK